ncbi:hypothetical protein GOODEAATRI_032825, partial [Goodea atripinnis]
DVVLTLEAITEYSRVVPRATLNQDINIRYTRKGALGRVQLSLSRPVATPIQQYVFLLDSKKHFALIISAPSPPDLPFLLRSNQACSSSGRLCEVQTSSKRDVYRVHSDCDEDPAAHRCGTLPGGPETATNSLP